MKKAVILLLFCLPILRGAVALNAQDSTRIIVNAQITDSSCHYKYRVVVQMMDGQPPYRFVLDSTLVSTTGIYENLSPGPHFLRVTDALGKISSRSIGLPYTNAFDLRISSESLADPCHNTTNLDHRITVSNGLPPYTFRVNGGASTTNNIVRLNAGNNLIQVKDANNCENSTHINTFHRKDSLRVSATFTPNSCGDSVGTIRITVTDTNSTILRPLSISFNGRPFSGETVFQNVVVGLFYTNLEIRVKTVQGCELVGNAYVYRPHYRPDLPQLQVDKYPTCADKFGRGSAGINVYHGTPPYRYTSNLTGTIANIENITTGTHIISITDAVGCATATNVTLTTCVWAGDTDTSGVVDNTDLLNIGLAFGETGPARCPTHRRDSCILWLPQQALDWSKQLPTRVNFKHIDTNGDGIINNDDTLAIKRNWNKIRQFRPSPTVEVRSSLPIFVETSPTSENQWAAFPVNLGDATSPANGVYGLAFSVMYDPSVIDASTMYFTYNQTWLGANNDLLSISKNDNGRLDIALTRTNHTNTSGKGQIGTLHFKIKNGVANKPLNFSITDPTLINNTAQVIPTNPRNTTTTISTKTVEPSWAARVSIYPNPSRGQFFISAQDFDIQEVTVSDISGKIIFHTFTFDKNSPLSIEQAGTFFLKVQTSQGVISRKVVRL